MSEQNLGARPSQNSDPAILIEPHDLESARQMLMRADAAGAEPAASLAEFERNQLARDIADIEAATAALRRAQPALQSWTKPQAPATTAKSRPLWLLMGLLWLSTAIVTMGAAYAIAALYG